jgi:hypothetical protein
VQVICGLTQLQREGFCGIYYYVGWIGWAGHVTRTAEKKIVYRLMVGNLKEREHFVDLRVVGMTRLKWILRLIRREDVDRIHLPQDEDK